MMELKSGVRVQVVPYGENYSYDYLGHLDGEIAEVRGVPFFDPSDKQRKVVLKLSGGLGAVKFPIQALRRLEDANT